MWKCLIGLDQSWILFEFTLNLRHAIKTTQADGRSSLIKSPKLTKLLRTGRLLMSLTILAIAVTMFVVLATKVGDSEAQFLRDETTFRYIFSAAFFAVSAWLTYAVFCVR